MLGRSSAARRDGVEKLHHTTSDNALPSKHRTGMLASSEKETEVPEFEDRQPDCCKAARLL
jgi:hypothetical protein